MALVYTLVDDFDGKIRILGNSLLLVSELSAGTYNFTINATDSNGWSKSYNGFFIVVDEAPVGYITLKVKASDYTYSSLRFKKPDGSYSQLYGKNI